MEEIMSDEATPSQIGALLIGAAHEGRDGRRDRRHGARHAREGRCASRSTATSSTSCSTGGGSFDPFNISTAAALVCAGAGVTVAKHGNRGFTSRCGAADVLEALGAKIDLTPEQAQACIEKTGFGFLFAPVFPPGDALRRADAARDRHPHDLQLARPADQPGRRAVPAPRRRRRRRWSTKIAQVLARLGTGRALVVHSEDGLDEVSLGAPTQVYEVTGTDVRHYTLTPEDAGLRAHPARGGEDAARRPRTPTACAPSSTARRAPTATTS